jgi:hypothetical protein
VLLAAFTRDKWENAPSIKPKRNAAIRGRADFMTVTSLAKSLRETLDGGKPRSGREGAFTET